MSADGVTALGSTLRTDLTQTDCAKLSRAHPIKFDSARMFIRCDSFNTHRHNAGVLSLKYNVLQCAPDNVPLNS